MVFWTTLQRIVWPFVAILQPVVTTASFPALTAALCHKRGHAQGGGHFQSAAAECPCNGWACTALLVVRPVSLAIALCLLTRCPVGVRQFALELPSRTAAILFSARRSASARRITSRPRPALHRLRPAMHAWVGRHQPLPAHHEAGCLLVVVGLSVYIANPPARQLSWVPWWDFCPQWRLWRSFSTLQTPSCHPSLALVPEALAVASTAALCDGPWASAQTARTALLLRLSPRITGQRCRFLSWW